MQVIEHPFNSQAKLDAHKNFKKISLTGLSGTGSKSSGGNGGGSK